MTRSSSSRRGWRGLTAPLLAALAAAAPGQGWGEDYWDRYLACLLASPANVGRAASCRTYVAGLEGSFRTTAVAVAQTVGPLVCDTATEHFTGTGIVIDRATCGPRPARSSCAMSSGEPPSCPSASALPTGDGEGDPVVSWCGSCRPTVSGPVLSGSDPRGCFACDSRDDEIDNVVQSFHGEVSKLMTCFGPADSARSNPHVAREDGTFGPFPNRALLAMLRETLSHHVARGGINIRCPSAEVSRGSEQRGAFASADNHAISVLPGGMFSASTLAHEFMHLSSSLGPGRGCDDQSHGTHNHPDSTHPSTTGASGVETEDTTTTRGMPNRHYDRVYSCQSLCFGSGEVISRDECNRCLSYPGAPAATPPAQCRDLVPLDQLAAIREARERQDPRMSDCISATESALALNPRDMVRGNVNQEGASVIFNPGAGPSVNALINRCESAYSTVDDAYSAAIDGNPSDSRNLPSLRFSRASYSYRKLQFAIHVSCATRANYQAGFAECRRRAGGDPTGQTVCGNIEARFRDWMRGNDAKIQGFAQSWNTLVTHRDSATSTGGAIWDSSEIAGTTASSICGSQPAVPGTLTRFTATF